MIHERARRAAARQRDGSGEHAAAPWSRPIQIVIGGLLQGSVFAIVALGFSLVFRVTGVINLSQGAFCILGALPMYTLEQRFGWPIALAAPGAVAGTAICGPRDRRRRLRAGAVAPADQQHADADRGAAHPPGGLALVHLGQPALRAAAVLRRGAGAVCWVCACRRRASGSPAWRRSSSSGFWYLLMRTDRRQGAAGLRRESDGGAADGHRRAAHDAGELCPRRPHRRASAASWSAPITSLQFDTGRFFTISGFIAVAIGGLGSFVGAVVGGLVLGVAEQLAAGYVSSLFANSLALGLLLVVLLWRPNGLFAAGRRGAPTCARSSASIPPSCACEAAARRPWRGGARRDRGACLCPAHADRSAS